MKKNLPNPEPVSNPLFGLHYQTLRWELLKTALELSLFDQLSVPAAAAEISTRLQTDPVNTEHMLNGLVALGCLSKKDGQFMNTPLAEVYLTDGKDTSLRESLLFQESWITPVLNGGLMKLVKEGPFPMENLASEDIWEKGAWCGLNYNRCGRAQRMASLVAELPEFAGFKKMMDMGGGSGIIGIAVAALHPSLECVLYDQPAVGRVAEKVVAEYGVGDRVSVIKGDYMADPIGGDYDLIMANYTLNFYIDRLDEIMLKVYQALNPGGLFLVTSDGMNQEKTAPAACVLTWLPTILQGADISFPAGLVAEKMLKAGFQSTERRALLPDAFDPHGPVELTIGRKGALT